jgi:poly(A) polymerase
MTKLLRAPDPAPAVAVMAQTGVLLALLDGGDPKPLAPLVHLEQSLSAPPDALRRLAALGLFDGAVLRLPKAAQRRLDMTRTLIGDLSSAEELAYRHGKDMARDVLLLRAALFETELQPGLDQAIDTGASARFPISAKDLMPKLQGAALGQALKRLEDLWIASGFAMTKEALLQEV